jgi:hypothetical protein
MLGELEVANERELIWRSGNEIFAFNGGESLDCAFVFWLNLYMDYYNINWINWPSFNLR